MKKLILLLIFAYISCGKAPFPDGVQMLDKEIAQKELYDKAFKNRVLTLSQSLNWVHDPEQQFKVNKLLADEYSHHCFDSSQCYYLKNLALAKQLGDKMKIAATQISLAENFVYGGFFNEAVESIKSVDTLVLDEHLRQEYIYAKVILSRNLRTHGPNAQTFAYYQKQFEKYLAVLKTMVDSSGFRYAYVEWEESRNSKDLEAGPELARRMVAKARVGTCDYSEACFYASISYSELGDIANRLYYLCLSATNDIRTSKKDDNRAIADICGALLGTWDGTAKAFHYVTELALSNILEFGGTRDMDYISKVMKQVESEYRRYSTITHYSLVLSLIAVCLLVVVLMFVLKLTRSNNKNLRKVKDTLSETNRVKEQYISSFITQISDAATERRKYYNHIAQMIRKGKSEELLKELASMPKEDTEIRNFNRMFDSTFLDIYPDFIDKFNSLLKPGEEIRPRGEGNLCPELRIYALVKLGIKDLKKVAALLKYSQTTVYNYRTKVKSKAKCSDIDFDSQISKL